MESNTNLADGLSAAQRKTLSAALVDYSQSSVTYTSSEISETQRSALSAYLREPGHRGNEESSESDEDRLSDFVSGDVAEAIDNMLPRILNIVEKTPRFVEFESVQGSQAEAMEQGLAVERTIRDQQQEPHRIIHDYAKSGLLFRLGVVRIQWWVPVAKPFVMENLTQMDVMQLIQRAMASDDLQINSEIEIVEGQDPDIYEGGKSFTVRGMRTPPDEIVIQNLAPESILVPPYCETLDQRSTRGAPYVGSREMVTLSQLRDQFPDSQKIIDYLDPDKETDPSGIFMTESGSELHNDERRYSRFYDEQSGQSSGGERSNTREKHSVSFYNEFLRHDLDGDGHAELLHIQRAEGAIISVTEVADNHFAWWCPFPIPNKAIGESLADKVMEFQHLNTALTQHMLNATAMAINPRVFLDATRLHAGDIEFADTIDDLLDKGTGTVVRVTGNPKEVVSEWAPGADSARAAHEALKYFHGRREERTGITPASKGEQAGVNRTAAGMAMGQGAATFYASLVADNFGEGIRLMALKIRNMLRESGGDKMKVRQGDEMLEVDPSKWTMLDCRVNVSGAMMNAQEKMTFLTMLMEQGRGIIDAYGPGNPMFGLSEIRSLLTEQSAIMGINNPERFFKAITPEQEQELIESMENAPDPAMAKIEAESNARMMQMQMDSELKIMQMEQDGQLAQAKMQHDAQIKLMEAQAGIQLDAQVAQIKAAGDMSGAEMAAKLKAAQAQIDAQIETQKTQIDATLKTRTQDLEASLKVRQQDLEARLREREMKLEAKTKAKISGVRPGGKVG